MQQLAAGMSDAGLPCKLGHIRNMFVLLLSKFLAAESALKDCGPQEVGHLCCLWSTQCGSIEQGIRVVSFGAQPVPSVGQIAHTRCVPKEAEIEVNAQ